MRCFNRILFALLSMIALPSIVHAQDNVAARSVAIERWVEEWDSGRQQWIRVEAIAGGSAARPLQPAATVTEVVIAEYTFVERAAVQKAARYAKPITNRSVDVALAQYGPFQVLGSGHAALVGPTGPTSPHYFDAMMRDFPELERLELIEAPGTSDDIANLAVGRRIRAAGIATHVPNGGSVRSGAVELFLAGAERTMENGAEFAVHSWLDNYGREPKDFAPDAPENRLYLDYYREMGMSAERARDFYAMTNSVPHRSAKWLDAKEMRLWLRPEQPILNRKRVIDQHYIAPHAPVWVANAPIQFHLARLDSVHAFP